MNRPLTKADLKATPLFWYCYIGLFRGYDADKEINIDEALQVLGINEEEFQKWEAAFFSQRGNPDYSSKPNGGLFRLH